MIFFQAERAPLRVSESGMPVAAIGAIPRRANRRTAHDTEKRLHIAAAHARIMHVLYMGAQRHSCCAGVSIFLPATREKFKAAIADLVRRGPQAVILGCTEFGMLLEAEDSPVPLIDNDPRPRPGCGRDRPGGLSRAARAIYRERLAPDWYPRVVGAGGSATRVRQSGRQ
jgi:hypothetical protein